MTSNSHSSDNGASLIAIAGANPTDADSSSAPDHQSTAHQIPLALQSDALRLTSNSHNHVGVGINAPAREPNGWAAKDAWARHQALISQLYLYEKKPLKEVMSHMKDQHGFKATIKMYKTHIKEWGLDKKIKDVEMKAVVRKSKQRADRGKSSIIRVRGQRRSLEDFVRHCDRKRVSIDDIIARHTSSPTPDTVELLTPVPSRISTPQALEVPERMFRCIRDYFSGSFESGTWVRTDPVTWCYSIKSEEKQAGVLVPDFLYQCIAACDMFSRNRFEEGGRTLNAAFALSKRILLEHDPHTIFQIFQLIARLRPWNRDKITLCTLRHLSDLNNLLLGREHPLTRIFGWYYDYFHVSDFDEIVSRCMEGMTDQFKDIAGAMHISTLQSRIWSIQWAAQRREGEVHKLQRLLSECEGKLQPYDDRVFFVRECLATGYYRQGHYVEASTMSQENFTNSQYIRTAYGKNYETYALYKIARCQYALGDVGFGIANLNEAINSRISIWGPQDTVARSWLTQLETWHLEQGNWDVAVQIRDYWVRTFPPIEE